MLKTADRVLGVHGFVRWLLQDSAGIFEVASHLRPESESHWKRLSFSQF